MKKWKISENANRFGMPVLMILFGLLLLLVPDSASVIVAYLVCGVLTFCGIAMVIMGLVDRRVSKILWALVCLGIGSALARNPLLLARNVGGFLGILLAMEGGSCLRKGNRTFGIVILAASAALCLSPMSLSRFVFSVCGLVVLAIGIGMLVNRLRDQRYLDKGDDNIIDAL